MAATEAEGVPAGVRLLRRAEELEDSFAAIHEARADTLFGLGVSYVRVHGARIAALARTARLPTLLARDGAGLGRTLAYGTSFAAATGSIAHQIRRVLHGERPGEIPIERVVRLGLVVNVDLARELGITIPPDLQACAVDVTAAS